MKRRLIKICSSLFFPALLLYGCSDVSNQTMQSSQSTTVLDASENTPLTSSASKKVSRTSKKKFEATKKILEPAADGLVTYGNTSVTIDASYSQEGYIMVKYHGDNPKVKLQITGSDQITYTYDLNHSYEAFPLTSGSGDYTVKVFEHLKDCEYTTAYSTKLTAQITNNYGPYLYPNQYVYYTADSETVKKAFELAEDSSSELDYVNRIFRYVTKEISYDYQKADSVKSGYLPDVDSVLRKKKGICFDYAVLMAAMLRSQGIPTRLEIGYPGEEYHSWISVHIAEKGWIGGVIRADGNQWTLVDPTFADSDKEENQEFIKDATNYEKKYVY